MLLLLHTNQCTTKFWSSSTGWRQMCKVSCTLDAPKRARCKLPSQRQVCSLGFSFEFMHWAFVPLQQFGSQNATQTELKRLREAEMYEVKRRALLENIHFDGYNQISDPTHRNLWNRNCTKRNVQTNFRIDIVGVPTSLQKSWAIDTHRSNACGIGGKMLGCQKPRNPKRRVDWMKALSTPNVR